MYEARKGGVGWGAHAALGARGVADAPLAGLYAVAFRISNQKIYLSPVNEV